MRSCEGHLGTYDASCQPCAARGHADYQTQVVRGDARSAARNTEIAINLSRRAAALRAELREGAAAGAPRTAAYHVALWRHSVDGRAYQRWSREASSVLARLELLNDIWRNGWIAVVETSLGHSLDVAVVFGAHRTVARIAVAVGAPVAIFGLLMQQDLVVDLGLAMLSWVGVAQWRQVCREAAAQAERTAVFGFDPTDRRALPPWSERNSQGVASGTLITGIRMLLRDAGRSSPVQSYLPLLEIPPVQPRYLPQVMHGVLAVMHEVPAPH